MVMLWGEAVISNPDVPNVKVLPAYIVIQAVALLAIWIPCHVMSPPNETVLPVGPDVLFHCPISEEVGTTPPVQLPVWLRLVAIFALTLVVALTAFAKTNSAMTEAVARCFTEGILRFERGMKRFY
jgi:hypothetical protein